MSPAKAQVVLQQALQHHQAGRLAPAAALYGEIRRSLPRHFEAHHLGGVAALQLGKISDAASLLQAAVNLRSDSATTYMCLGLAQSQLGRNPEAEKSLRTAVRLDPKNHESWVNLASVLVVTSRLEEAAEAYRSSLKIRPDFAQSWSGLGSVLQLMGKAREAVAHHTRALELDPLHPKAQASRAVSLQSLNEIDAAFADFEAHLARQPGDLESASFRTFLLNYSAEISREQLFAEHRAFGVKLATQIKPVSRNTFLNTRDPEKRLRVAFLSPDLRQHSVAFFLEPLLAHLDGERFEILLYHDHFCVDDTSRRLQKRAAVWRNFIGQSPTTVENEIRRDAPDILVDLSGHSGFNRMPLFGRRLAPVQVTYLGYPNTTGVPTMDYRLTDAIADPPGDSDLLHTETLVRFSSTAWAYSPPPDAPAPRLHPTHEPFTFGSFNTASKVNPVLLRLWAEILRRTPGSRLLIKSSTLVDQETLRTRAVAAGLDVSRLIMLPATPTIAEHLACYAHIDLALDCSPYNGTTTTCEALWMGVPIVTWRGDRHASRVGASLLTAVGHPEWIAYDAEHYVRLALELAAQPEKLLPYRASLRSEMRASALLDHAGQAEKFGAALRRCWADFCGPTLPADRTAPTAVAVSSR